MNRCETCLHYEVCKFVGEYAATYNKIKHFIDDKDNKNAIFYVDNLVCKKYMLDSGIRRASSETESRKYAIGSTDVLECRDLLIKEN